MEAHLEALRARILAEGRDLGSGILKVDSFINHQVDVALMKQCGEELARRFANVHITKSSPWKFPASRGHHDRAGAERAGGLCAQDSPVTMPDLIYLATAPSHTKGITVD